MRERESIKSEDNCLHRVYAGQGGIMDMHFPTFAQFTQTRKAWWCVFVCNSSSFCCIKNMEGQRICALLYSFFIHLCCACV